MAIAAAIPYVLQGASLLGGLFGKKKKAIDPEYLRQHFGPEAITARAQELANRIMASPYGQQLMASAAESGQGLQTEMNARAAAAGLSPETGGQSAASDFATSAASQAQGAFERQAKSSVWQQSLPIAQDLVAQELAAYKGQIDAENETPSLMQRIGTAASGAAAMFPTQATSGARVPVAAIQEAGASPMPQIQPRPVAPVIPQLVPSAPVPYAPPQFLPNEAAALNPIGGAVRRRRSPAQAMLGMGRGRTGRGGYG